MAINNFYMRMSGSGIGYSGVVDYYNQLPVASTVPGQIWYVRFYSLSTPLKRSGPYFSNGSIWQRGGLSSTFVDTDFLIQGTNGALRFDISAPLSTRIASMPDRDVNLANVLDKTSTFLHPYADGDGIRLYHTDGVQFFQMQRISGSTAISIGGTDNRYLTVGMNRAIFDLGGNTSTYYFDINNASNVTILRARGDRAIDVNESRIINYVEERFFNGTLYDNIKGFYQVKRVSAGEVFFTFQAPENLGKPVEIMVVFIPEADATINFGIDCHYGRPDEPYNQHSGSGSVRLDVRQDRITELKVAGEFRFLEADDMCGLRIRPDASTLHFLGIRLRYLTA